MGFIARVPAAELDAFVASNRTARAETFNLSPPGPRDEYFIIQYVEPERGNTALLGQDIGTDRLRREAAEMARDFGGAVLTRRLRLPQLAEDLPVVFLMLPVYRNDAAPRTMTE